jgi:hypothetical protein
VTRPTPYRLLLALLSVAAFAGCSREYARLKNSTRRVASEYTLLQRAAGELMRKLPGGAATADTQRLTPLAQRNLINTHRFLYSTLNPLRPEATDLRWDSTRQAFWHTDSSLRRVRFGAEVYGWHPTWMGDNWRHIPFRLLTTVAFHAYQVDPVTGGCLNPEDMDTWRTIALVDSAHARGCRVLLSVACDGEEQTRSLLNADNALALLADSVAALVSARGADGVELAFSGLAADQAPRLNAFVESLARRLDKAAPNGDGFLAVVIPPLDPDRAYDLPQLQRHADLMVVQGFEYPHDEDAPGAAAPLMAADDDGYSLDRTLRDHLAAGLDPEVSVLALPLYGHQWKDTLDAAEGTYLSRFDRKVALNEVRTLYRPADTSYELTSHLDPTSLTNYFLLEFGDSTAIECWYDDGFTLGRKMDLALARRFRGVGLWALGYDMGHDEVWRAVRDRFTTDTVRLSDPVAAIQGYPVRLADLLLRHADLITTAAAAFALTVVVSLLIAFSDWRVRASLFYSAFHFFLYLLACTLLLVPLLSRLGFFGDTRTGLLAAFLTGLAAGYLVFRLTRSLQFRRP